MSRSFGLSPMPDDKTLLGIDVFLDNLAKPESDLDERVPRSGATHPRLAAPLSFSDTPPPTNVDTWPGNGDPSAPPAPLPPVKVLQDTQSYSF